MTHIRSDFFFFSLVSQKSQAPSFQLNITTVYIICTSQNTKFYISFLSVSELTQAALISIPSLTQLLDAINSNPGQPDMQTADSNLRLPSMLGRKNMES